MSLHRQHIELLILLAIIIGVILSGWFFAEIFE